MYAKRFFYKDPDGDHFPDTFAGSEEIYELDLDYLFKETPGSIIDVRWNAPPFLNVTQGLPCFKTVCAKIRTPYPGSFKVTCKVTISRGSDLEMIVIPMVIKVY
jgi:hypothetical protein